MSKPEQMLHVITLTPEEQLTIVLLSRSYLKIASKGLMKAVANDPKTLDSKWGKLCDLNDIIDELTQALPNPATFDGTPARLYYFSTGRLRRIITILEQYDTKTAIMENEALQIVDVHYDDLLKKIKESSNFTYTMGEIDQAVKAAR